MGARLTSTLMALVALYLAPTPGHAAKAATWQPSMDQILALEHGLVMPEGADPLPSYARYYTGEDAAGRKIIRGYYLDGGRPGIYLKPSDVTIMDGGCSVVSVVFDVQSHKVLGVACNGVA